jgi:GTP-binding protein HflX
MEVADADVILLVVDASDPVEEMERKVNACLETFTKVEANAIPLITALNKIDLLDEDSISERIQHLPESCSLVIPISAEKGTNLDKLMIAVEEELTPLRRYRIVLPYGNKGMSALSWLHNSGDVESEQYVGSDIEIIANLSTEIVEKFTRDYPDVEMTRLDR